MDVFEKGERHQERIRHQYVRPVAEDPPPGPDHDAEELHPLHRPLEADLSRVQLQVKLFEQERPDGLDQRERLPAGMGNEIEIVHIASVVPRFQLPLHELVQRIEIHVREQLARQVPDGQPAPRRTVEQGLRRGQPVPILARAAYVATHGRIRENRHPHQQRRQRIHRIRAVPAPRERVHHAVIQDALVDGHEKSPQVQLQDPSLARVILRHAAEVVLQAVDPVGRALSLAATVTVRNEMALEDGREVVA